ncbi:MAG: uroporphyrinogen-III decarboxylase-like protein [Candidatus Omnitrophica bacterium]|nr:uroporphyrinogen-III decarboxylase-like protein [Candidatus Omnitrophota bacterium]
MTPRERWKAVLDRRTPDRIPCDFWSTPEVLSRLLRELRCPTEDDLWRALGIDRAHDVAPRFVGPEERKDNLWMIEVKEQVYGDGLGSYAELSHAPFAEFSEPEELVDFPWPDPDWFDFSRVADDLERVREWPIRGGGFEPFNLYCAMRGLELAFMDLATESPFLEAALERIFDFHYEFNRRLFEAAGWGAIDFTYVAEDFGGQNALLMSPDKIERFFIPRMKAMIDLAHAHGVRAFHHDDGAIRRIIPRMIEIGIDILNPIQWRCAGMEREGLKRDFGEQVVFHGGVDNQQSLPFGSPKDVRMEVLENIRILGAGGGYIVAPCHNIQPVSPTENILALYEAVRVASGG